MNYYAHARKWLDDPFFTAGSALPDWMGVVNRRVRLRSRTAEPWRDAPDPGMASLARGIMQHHQDDDRFHKTQAFAQLQWDFTVKVRDVLGRDAGFRPRFLGHILVELLLDATLIAREPDNIERYYRVLEKLDVDAVQAYVEKMADQAVEHLARFIRRFTEMRFLFDYLDDQKLFFRLNQIMNRVKLPQLPEVFMDILPDARAAVDARAEELLSLTHE